MRTAAGMGRRGGGEGDLSIGRREGMDIGRRQGGGVSNGAKVGGCNRWSRVFHFDTTGHPHAFCVGLSGFIHTNEITQTVHLAIVI